MLGLCIIRGDVVSLSPFNMMSAVDFSQMPLSDTRMSRSVKDGTSMVIQWLRIHGFHPWSGKIPNTAGQLSSCATASESVSCNYWACRIHSLCSHKKRNHHDEKSVHCNQSRPHSLQLEKAHAQQWWPSTTKTNKWEKKKEQWIIKKKKNCEGYELLQYFHANKLACYSFMDAGRKHVSGSETKEFITHSKQHELHTQGLGLSFPMGCAEQPSWMLLKKP